MCENVRSISSLRVCVFCGFSQEMLDRFFRRLHFLKSEVPSQRSGVSGRGSVRPAGAEMLRIACSRADAGTGISHQARGRGFESRSGQPDSSAVERSPPRVAQLDRALRFDVVVTGSIPVPNS